MRKRLLLMGFAALLTSAAFAQNNNGKADDMERIAITPVVDAQDAPMASKDMLASKMRQICTLNGLAGEGSNPLFSMKATIDVLSKELTATAPPMHALTMSVNLFIVDNETGNVYSQTSVEVKGVGQNETKAYIAAMRNIDPKRGQFKAFVDQGKNKIIEFYNSQCDFVISKANALKAQGRTQEASQVLYSVPKVCKDCYDQCMQMAGNMPVSSSDSGVSQADGSGNDDVQTVESNTMEIDNGIFVNFKGCKRYGNKSRMTFNIENQNKKDYEFKIYRSNIRVIDGEGNSVETDMAKIAGEEFSYNKTATIMNGTPVVLECEFKDVDTIKMFEIVKDGITYRMRLNLDCQ
ncbi:MAG: hypothetical protein IKW86_12355 [Salinivirgaceae bacterium]|nr:hypothetical protein [Salinivirgaceae bacterium]